MFMPFKDLFGNLESLAGTQVSVSGQLLIGEGDKPFLATNYESYKRGERLPVADGKLIATHLLATLPVYGGGDVMYDEEACLTGTVVQQPGGYELAFLSYCKVVRDDIEILIPLGSRRDNSDS